MKKQAATYILVVALMGICAGQQSEEEKRFCADYARSEQRALAAFPDAGNSATPLAQKVAEMNKALAAEEDPLLDSADKPLILTRKAAKLLGISPLEGKLQLILEPQASVKLDGQVIPELNGYKAVTIRSVEPDGLRVIHESGASKIPIEKLTEEQQAKYGLTMEGAAQYRQHLAENLAKDSANLQDTSKIQATTSEASAPTPATKFITADQVKVMWVRKLPLPRSLDANYSKILATYREFIADIKAGGRDLEAQETAATYNKALAVQAGNIDLIQVYETELGRISTAKIAAAEAESAAAALAQDKEQAQQDRADLMMLNSELDNIDRKLRNLHTTIEGL